MAEKKQSSQSQSLAEGVDKELTCAICLCRYNQPKLLPCLHSYCKGCLQDLLKKSRGKKRSITCPQCKVIHELPPQGIDGFTTFFTINNLLELLNIHESSGEEKPKCTSGLDENPAIARCLTCSDYLCESCYGIHQKQRVTRNHIVKTLQEIKQSDKKTGVKSLHKRQHCQEHEEELLKLYCQTCKKVICRDCALVTHREHNYAFVREVRTDIQKKLEEQILKVQAKEIEFQNHQNYSSNLLKIAREAAKSSQLKVNKVFDEVIAAFEKRRTEVLSEVCTIHESEVKQITLESESIALSLLRLSDSIRFTRQLLDNGDDVEVMAVCDQTEQTLASLTKLVWDTSMLKPSLLRPEFSESMQENITKFGRVLHAIQPNDIVLSNIPPKVPVGKESRFEVHISREILEKGYDVSIGITISKPKAWVPTPVEVEKKAFNSWLISFTPYKTGEYKIIVQIDGTPSISRVITVVKPKYMYNETDDEGVNLLDSDPEVFHQDEGVSNKVQELDSESNRDTEDMSQDDIQSASSRQRTASASHERSKDAQLQADIHKPRKQRYVKANTNTGHSRKSSFRKR